MILKQYYLGCLAHASYLIGDEESRTALVVESISMLVYDLQQDEQQPHAVLTGDTLFIGDVGHPDLRAALGWSASELASMLYDSLHDKLLTLPDETLVYPAHGAGSLCGKNLSSDTVSTLGVQRRSNYALQPMSREKFIRMLLADQPDAPSYFTYDAILNTQERPTFEQTLRQVLKPLTLEDVPELQHAGAQLLDVRDAADFARAYLVDSVNIGLGGLFATTVRRTRRCTSQCWQHQDHEQRQPPPSPPFGHRVPHARWPPCVYLAQHLCQDHP